MYNTCKTSTANDCREVVFQRMVEMDIDFAKGILLTQGNGTQSQGIQLNNTHTFLKEDTVTGTYVQNNMSLKL